MKRLLLALLLTLPVAASAATPDEILGKAPKSAWVPLNPADTLYMDLPGGRVVILLAPGFAPKTVANIRKLVHGGYFSFHAAITRSQDNYVVQWSRDPEPPAGKGWAEFDHPLDKTFAALPDPDTYAAKAGFDSLFPAASDGKREWLVHCYGMVGAGRDMAANSGTGAELYAVTGQAPRHLDRNITLVGRVVQGMELLSSLPRGTGKMGFYEKGSANVPIQAMYVASDLPAAQREKLFALRTDTPVFRAYVEARRNRQEKWFVRPAGHVDVCNVPLPVRRVQ